jgi:Uma2 family endonuclease
MSAVLTPSLPTAPSLPAPIPAATTSPAPPVVVQPSPQPFRWTINQYRELAKTGLFTDTKTMLLDGEIIRMPPPKPPHDVALALTDAWLRTVFATGYFVRGQMGFDIGEATDPSPDLAVVAGSIRDHLHATPREAVLVVEVAESTLFYDTTTKAEKYATAGVQDYWVIDLENRQLIVYRDPVPLPQGLGATAYRQRNTYDPDAVVAPLAAPSATTRVADLLP